MKILILFNLIIIFGNSLGNQNYHSIQKVYENGTGTLFPVPQSDGTFKWMTYDEAKCENQQTIIPKSEVIPIKFFLYTRKNPSVGKLFTEGNKLMLLKSNFNPKNPTRFIIHGWMSDLFSALNTLIRDAYLSRGDHNIFVVDWGAEAKNFNYLTARFKVEQVGKQVAEFIDLLKTHGKMSFNYLQVIGHSLGAHVAGFTGKNVKTGKIPIIFGLDPALPLFFYDEVDERLSNADAIYVETIHTSGGYLGFMKPIGKASFYPNWGSSQPGCGFDLTKQCSHRRSYELFADAIENEYFLPHECNSFDDLKNQQCSNAIDNKIKMGSYLNAFRNAKGIYYLPTNPEKPFGSKNITN